MTTRRPLVLVSGSFSELPTGDTVAGASVPLLANPSGLLSEGGSLGIDGVALVSGQAAQVTANTALASGNAALSVAVPALALGNAALSSGNAALLDASYAQASGNAALLDITYTFTSTATSTTVSDRERLTVLATGVLVTLPGSPSQGDQLSIGTISGVSDTVVSGNGSPIMERNEDLTIDVADVNVTMIYVDGSLGWRIY